MWPIVKAHIHIRVHSKFDFWPIPTLNHSTEHSVSQRGNPPTHAHTHKLIVCSLNLRLLMPTPCVGGRTSYSCCCSMTLIWFSMRSVDRFQVENASDKLMSKWLPPSILHFSSSFSSCSQKEGRVRIFCWLCNIAHTRTKSCPFCDENVESKSWIHFADEFHHFGFL